MKISMVVPLQDEAHTVEALLHSIRKQVRPPDELILVDAGSRDDTIARAGTVSLPFPVKVVPVGRVFPGAARNEGVRVARSDWIAFTDGGIQLADSWLQELVRSADDDTEVVFGVFDPVCNTVLRQCAALAYVSARDRRGTRGRSIASCLVSRSAFARTGGFPDHRAAEDLVFFERLRSIGAREAWAPAAKVAWQLPGTVRATFKRFALYSEHNLRAGWGRHWHLGIARLYGLLVLGLGAAGAVGAGLSVVAAIPLFWPLRALKAAWVKRGSFDFCTIHPVRVLGAAFLLLVIDTATLVGAARWVLGGRRS